MRWTDYICVFWVLFVVAVYYGGSLLPASIGVYTPALAMVYAIILMVSISVFVIRCRRDALDPKAEGPAEHSTG